MAEPVPEPEPEPEPVVPPETPVTEKVPEEVPNPEEQDSANPQEPDTPKPVIVSSLQKSRRQPEPVPVPTQEVAEAKDAPIPPQKPEPPKKKEVKKKDETKKAKQGAELRPAPEGYREGTSADSKCAAAEQDEPVEQPQTENIVQLSASELDAIRQQFKGCWDIDPGSRGHSEHARGDRG